MKIHSYTVTPNLPESLSGLMQLAGNLFWSWDHEVRSLFMRLEPDLWEDTGHNPVLVLGRLSNERLEELSMDEVFLSHLERARERFEEYMSRQSWFAKAHEKAEDMRVAYFSAEYGLTECIPIYSGGLGVLSGDHLKAASDLGLPLVGVGLLYGQGYFKQYLNPSGWQQERYVDNDFFNLPINKVEKDGSPLVLEMDMAGNRVFFQVWRIDVGRVPLYLLDTDLDQNGAKERSITARLYGGDLETRIRQEMVLGIGGMMALKALGIEPDVCHMNEGHSAFLALERIKTLIQDHGLTFREAKEAASAGNLFTTHTPVPAGFDVFPVELVEKYLGSHAKALGLSLQELMDLGRERPGDEAEGLNMAMLAVRLSDRVNGVSQLHARVTRKMWSHVWPDLPEEEVPVQPLTNGVHVASWVSHDMAALLDRYLGPLWRVDPAAPEAFARVDEIPDEELWTVHERRRSRLVAFARKRLKEQLLRRGLPESARADDVLRPDALTIGFARRFATYKRATLLLQDPERLERLLGSDDRPVQILFAGKAHPKDEEGKALIREIVRFASGLGHRSRMVFLEDYDLNLARYMVQGVDLWLNTPRRPREASGTSGMKVLPNGGLNASILDGWWAEAYSEDVGWAIGAGEEYGEEHEHQDRVESEALYSLLEEEIVPLFFQRGPDGVPRSWLKRVKASMRMLASTYTTTRMVKEYTEWHYLPGYGGYRRLSGNDFSAAKDLAAWLQKVEREWPQVGVVGVDYEKDKSLCSGEPLEVKAEVELAGLSHGDVAVELYCGRLDRKGKVVDAVKVEMEFVGESGSGSRIFKGFAPTRQSGRLGFAVRVFPQHPLLVNPLKLGLVKWER